MAMISNKPTLCQELESWQIRMGLPVIPTFWMNEYMNLSINWFSGSGPPWFLQLNFRGRRFLPISQLCLSFLSTSWKNGKVLLNHAYLSTPRKEVSNHPPSETVSGRVWDNLWAGILNDLIDSYWQWRWIIWEKCFWRCCKCRIKV